MKVKSIFIAACIFLFFLTSPIIAQGVRDLGPDPDAPRTDAVAKAPNGKSNV